MVLQLEQLADYKKFSSSEIHVVDTQSLRIDKFGQDLNCSDKTYVIYDGTCLKVFRASILVAFSSFTFGLPHKHNVKKVYELREDLLQH